MNGRLTGSSTSWPRCIPRQWTTPRGCPSHNSWAACTMCSTSCGTRCARCARQTLQSRPPPATPPRCSLSWSTSSPSAGTSLRPPTSPTTSRWGSILWSCLAAWAWMSPRLGTMNSTSSPQPASTRGSPSPTSRGLLATCTRPQTTPHASAATRPSAPPCIASCPRRCCGSGISRARPCLRRAFSRRATRTTPACSAWRWRAGRWCASVACCAPPM
mmetsp:Transcript_28401/g.71321  ORF Transcript_28401/g.71321 Transcript_28401/m.71321 type:complete len:216 (+) Transcript_28401:242-889(+)